MASKVGLRFHSPRNEVDQNASPSQLFHLVAEKDSSKAISRCQLQPDEARIWVVRKDNEQRIIWRRLPLHEACIHQPENDLIDALLQAYPVGASQEDHNGRLPIHHACFYGASKEVIDKLLMAYPESVEAKDMWEKTPLNVAQGSTNKNQDIHSILDALSKKATYYLLKNEETKWFSEAEKRFGEKEKSLQQQLDSCTEKFKNLQEEVESDRERFLAKEQKYETDLASLEKKAAIDHDNMRQEINDLSQDLDRAKHEVKIREAKVQEYEDVHRALDTSNETNRKLQDEKNDALSEVASLNRRLQDIIAMQNEQEKENQLLKQKLIESENTEKELKNDVEEANQNVAALRLSHEAANGREELLQKEIKSLGLELEAKCTEKEKLVEKTLELKNEVDMKLILESKIEELNVELGRKRDEYKSALDSHQEQKQMLELQIESLKAKVSELESTMDELERKAEEDAATIASIGKSAADAYLHSSECIAQFETKLSEANTKLSEAASDHVEEKEKFKYKIASLEATIRKLISKRAEEQRQTVESFTELERALKHADDERTRMLETLMKQKRALKGAGETQSASIE